MCAEACLAQLADKHLPELPARPLHLHHPIEHALHKAQPSRQYNVDYPASSTAQTLALLTHHQHFTARPSAPATGKRDLRHRGEAAQHNSATYRRPHWYAG
jgi:hypothetical protein